MRVKVVIPILAAVSLISGPAFVAGQAVTIISNNDEAQQCSMAAHTAAQARFTSREDLETCNRALDTYLKPKDRAGTYVNRGIVASALSRYQEAYEDYLKAMEIMPDLPEAYIGRGNIYFMAGKLDKAVEDYSHALELDLQRDHVAFLNRGMAYEKMKQYADAEEDYLMALESSPDWSLARQKLSRVRAKQTVNQ